MKRIYILGAVGLILIIIGLLIIIFWQRGFVQLQPLECPKFRLWFT